MAEEIGEVIKAAIARDCILHADVTIGLDPFADERERVGRRLQIQPTDHPLDIAQDRPVQHGLLRAKDLVHGELADRAKMTDAEHGLPERRGGALAGGVGVRALGHTAEIAGADGAAGQVFGQL